MIKEHHENIITDRTIPEVLLMFFGDSNCPEHNSVKTINFYLRKNRIKIKTRPYYMWQQDENKEILYLLNEDMTIGRNKKLDFVVKNKTNDSFVFPFVESTSFLFKTVKGKTYVKFIDLTNKENPFQLLEIRDKKVFTQKMKYNDIIDEDRKHEIYKIFREKILNFTTLQSTTQSFMNIIDEKINLEMEIALRLIIDICNIELFTFKCFYYNINYVKALKNRLALTYDTNNSEGKDLIDFKLLFEKTYGKEFEEQTNIKASVFLSAISKEYIESKVLKFSFSIDTILSIKLSCELYLAINNNNFADLSHSILILIRLEKILYERNVKYLYNSLNPTTSYHEINIHRNRLILKNFKEFFKIKILQKHSNVVARERKYTTTENFKLKSTVLILTAILISLVLISKYYSIF